MTSNTLVETLNLAKRFLRYSFHDIAFDYDRLTRIEQLLCTRAEFALLVKWIGESDAPLT